MCEWVSLPSKSYNQIESDYEKHFLDEHWVYPIVYIAGEDY